MLPFIAKAAQFVGKVAKAGKQAQATVNKYRPAPKPAPKPAPRPIVVVKQVPAPKPVAVIPPPPRPVAPVPKKTDTVRVLGMDVPKPAAYVGGTVLALGAVYGISRAVR